MFQSAVFNALVVGHLLADFPLQTDVVYRLKQQGWKGLLLHSGIHMVVSIALLPDLFHRLGLLFVLGASHMVVDALKPRIRFVRPSVTFLLDQSVHVLILFIITWFVRDVEPSLSFAVLNWLLLLALIPAVLMLISLLKQEGSLKWQWALARAGAEKVAGKLYQIAGWTSILLMAIFYLRIVG